MDLRFATVSAGSGVAGGIFLKNIRGGLFLRPSRLFFVLGALSDFDWVLF